jgi:hypothetical protein
MSAMHLPQAQQTSGRDAKSRCHLSPRGRGFDSRAS